MAEQQQQDKKQLLSKMLRVYKTVCEMMIDRGFTDPAEQLLDEINRSEPEHFYTAWEQMNQGDVLQTQGLRIPIKVFIGENKACYVIFRRDDSPLTYDQLTTHMNELSQRNMYKIQLPKILPKDPVTKYFGLKRGNIFKIIRDSETAGKFLMFDYKQQDLESIEGAQAPALRRPLFTTQFFEELLIANEEQPTQKIAKLSIQVKQNTLQHSKESTNEGKTQQELLRTTNFFNPGVQPFLFHVRSLNSHLYKIFLPTATNPIVRQQDYYLTNFDKFPIWFSSVVSNNGDMFIIGGCDPLSGKWNGPKVDWILHIHAIEDGRNTALQFQYQQQQQQQQQQQHLLRNMNSERYTATNVGRLRMPRDVIASCYHDGYVYLVGGRNNQLQCTRVFERFSVEQALSGNQFVCENLNDCLVEAQQSAVIVLQNRYLYKIGGWKRRYVPNECIERYDFQSKEWNIVVDFSREKSLIHLTTSGGACQISENEILCFGGWYDKFSSITERTFVINSENSTEVTISTHNRIIMPTRGGLWFPQCVALQNKIYTLQNIEYSSCDGTFYTHIQRLLCFDGKQWQTLPIQKQIISENLFQQINDLEEDQLEENDIEYELY